MGRDRLLALDALGDEPPGPSGIRRCDDKAGVHDHDLHAMTRHPQRESLAGQLRSLELGVGAATVLRELIADRAVRRADGDRRPAMHDATDLRRRGRGHDALRPAYVDRIEILRLLRPEIKEARQMEDDFASGERFHDLLGAPDVTDDWLRTEVPHLRHARDTTDEANDGVVAPYERRDKRSTERAGRSGDENSHDDS